MLGIPAIITNFAWAEVSAIRSATNVPVRRIKKRSISSALIWLWVSVGRKFLRDLNNKKLLALPGDKCGTQTLCSGGSKCDYLTKICVCSRGEETISGVSSRNIQQQALWV